MEPIIQPSLIYWINALDTLHNVLIACSVIFGIGFAASLICYIYNVAESVEYSSNEQYIPVCKKWTIRSLVLFAVSMISIIFVPTKGTSLEMLVANYITPDNLALGVDGIKTLINDIVDSIAKLM